MMEKYKFIDNYGSFSLNNPDRISGLYFPIANAGGMKSCVTPTLGGDAKTGQNTFLLQPVSIRELSDSRVSRNFWAYIENYGAWSVTGASAKQESDRFAEPREEDVTLTAGMLWQKLTRKNRTLGLSAEVLSFCPVTDDAVELHKITITNNSDRQISFKPYSAVPLYCRSADNIRDHRHVTSLLHRTVTDKYGITVNPTLTFDERGHRKNEVIYGAHAICSDGSAPIGFISSVDEFIGEGGTLTNPRSIGTDFPYTEGYCLDGEECIAAMQFKTVTLKPEEKISYILVLSVNTPDVTKYLSASMLDMCFEDNKAYWRSAAISHIHTADSNFDNWIKWVSIQPLLRRIYGCSFLPHHDYGRGGRGWRDLWQDCLALLLSDSSGVKDMLINNFAGVRIDGTNATIIGEKSGEFIADRNNITRVWMDHGAWANVTMKLYIDQTGDIDILLKNQTYFKDIQTCRATEKDTLWNDSLGNKLMTESKTVYEGSILEHLLVQNLTAFFNVGEHNIMRLEGADWNDGLDMAAERGESVAFTCLYYKNLLDIADFVKALMKDGKEITVAKELLTLFDAKESNCDYNNICYKKSVLSNYCSAVKHIIKGEKVLLDANMLISDLTAKAEHIKEQINQNEIIATDIGSWYNSYYDNSGRKVEGIVNGDIRMMLTGQVFAIMSGIADEDMINNVTLSADKLLFNSEIGGYKLNTDFKEVKTDLGRLFGFAYGTKENGAVFSHMSVMYGNALYGRNHAAQGYKSLEALFLASDNFGRSHIYPGIPEYFDTNGKGLYSYLTGSASWLMMTVICEMFGVKGKNGNLYLEPKLLKHQFDISGKASIKVRFSEHDIMVEYLNSDMLDYGEYSVKDVVIDGMPYAYTENGISKAKIETLSSDSIISVFLG